MPNLTQRFIEALKTVDSEAVHWDSDHKGAVRGFGLRVKTTGVRSFIIQYRNREGVSRRLTLGRYPDMQPEAARSLAKSHLGTIGLAKSLPADTAEIEGADPAAEKQAKSKAITVAQLCDEYLKANEGLIKASTLAMDRSRINCHVKPLIGSKRVASLTRGDVEQFQADIAKGKTAKKKPKNRKGRGGLAAGGSTVASRTVGMLGTILQRAVDAGAIDKNPARGVKRPKDKARKPPFSFEAIEALGKAMREAAADDENRTGLAAIRALLLTGCRRMEALSMLKAGVDFKSHCVRFADTKSGPQMRTLGEAAITHLRPLVETKGSPFVFPSEASADPDDPKHFVALPDVWKRVCDRAKIKGVTIHGMRHWFASAAVEIGYSELIIAALLGHKMKGITPRYATAPDPALIAAADRISNRLANALDGVKDKGTVVDFPGVARA